MKDYDEKRKGLVSRPKKKVFLAELVLTSLFKCDNQSKALMKNEDRAEEENRNSNDFVLNNALLPAETIGDDNANFTLDKTRWNALRAALDASPRDIPALRELLIEPDVFVGD